MGWKIFFYGYELLLLVYTGWRTGDFLYNQLPKGGDNTLNLVLSIAFLAATEIGLILWHFLGRKDANTTRQDQASQLMTWVDFIGSLAAGIGDMVIHQTLLEGYVLPPIIGYVLLYGLPLLVALNVGAGLVYSRNNASELLERKEKQINFAKTDLELTIRDETIKKLNASKAAIVNEVLDEATDKLRKDVLRSVAGAFKLDTGKFGGADDAPKEDAKPATEQPSAPTVKLPNPQKVPYRDWTPEQKEFYRQKKLAGQMRKLESVELSGNGDHADPL